MTSVLKIPAQAYKELISHLMPKKPISEEAAFVFCTYIHHNAHVQFIYADWHRPEESDFTYKSIFGLELTDNCRARVIKRAHDLSASIVEMHSHPLSNKAEFSPSDRLGFLDFVPHVRWRLKQRPYGAIVVGRRGFDSLSWFSSSSKPDGVLEVQAGTERLRPTGRTYSRWEENHDF